MLHYIPSTLLSGVTYRYQLNRGMPTTDTQIPLSQGGPQWQQRYFKHSISQAHPLSKYNAMSSILIDIIEIGSRTTTPESPAMSQSPGNYAGCTACFYPTIQKISDDELPGDDLFGEFLAA